MCCSSVISNLGVRSLLEGCKSNSKGHEMICFYREEIFKRFNKYVFRFWSFRKIMDNLTSKDHPATLQNLLSSKGSGLKFLWRGESRSVESYCTAGLQDFPAQYWCSSAKLHQTWINPEFEIKSRNNECVTHGVLGCIAPVLSQS